MPGEICSQNPWKIAMKKLIFGKIAGFSEHLFAALKPIQGILSMVLKLLKSSTKFRLLEPGNEVWCEELSNISISVDIWHPLLF